MFSTLSSFLPAALQQTDDKFAKRASSSQLQAPANPSPAAAESTEQTVTPASQAAEAKPAEETAHKRKRNTHEVCIVFYLPIAYGERSTLESYPCARGDRHWAPDANRICISELTILSVFFDPVPAYKRVRRWHSLLVPGRTVHTLFCALRLPSGRGRTS